MAEFFNIIFAELAFWLACFLLLKEIGAFVIWAVWTKKSEKESPLYGKTKIERNAFYRQLYNDPDKIAAVIRTKKLTYNQIYECLKIFERERKNHEALMAGIQLIKKLAQRKYGVPVDEKSNPSL